MPRTITLCYRKIIDAAATTAWDRLVWEDTYQEFRLQAQTLDPARQHRTFGQLLQHVAGAERLHFLVSAAVRGYLQQLGGLVPDIVDNLGRRFLPFSQFQFELINSDLQDRSRHQVAVNFYSDALTWHDTISTNLLVSVAGAAPAAPGAGQPTHLVALQPFLAISTLLPAAPPDEADAR
ncbi:hypothetical protein LJ737_25585 [Hymenobacter sp. 15J16-1T3B]|uniref:hypothetical protein n=1 Tax=Hymenobacter sp. 15J16-1T3B TaxID=2886941 RepID=UPI001D0F8B2F|nr:hypothetical protein [Hymenobacter sp. 15J16-1T3B]MCC3160636.1 hypothetical protein [Hymenobacter sp. 15J16-1T3B]